MSVVGRQRPYDRPGQRVLADGADVAAAAPPTWSGSGTGPWARALRTGRGPLFLHRGDGWLQPLDVEHWCGRPDTADRTVLDRCRGSVLDIGCGPGRLVGALAERGVPALGIDVSAEAVRRTEQAGASALVRSVFEPLPGEGRWDTVLLIDGNIGIGGDPAALLARLARVVAPHGTLLVEAASSGPGTEAADLDERMDVTLHDGRAPHGPTFPWARVGPAALTRHAAASGWTPLDTWTAHTRHFTALRPT